MTHARCLDRQYFFGNSWHEANPKREQPGETLNYTDTMHDRRGLINATFLTGLNRR